MPLILNKGSWDELKAKLKKEYPQLTESDLLPSEDKKESMFMMIEYKLRKTKQEMQEIIAVLGYARSEI